MSATARPLVNSGGINMSGEFTNHFRKIRRDFS